MPFLFALIGALGIGLLIGVRLERWRTGDTALIDARAAAARWHDAYNAEHAKLKNAQRDLDRVRHDLGHVTHQRDETLRALRRQQARAQREAW